MPQNVQTNAIEQIRDYMVQLFADRNPNQYFCLMMPGTSLDAGAYVYNPRGEKPGVVVEAESRLVDQMFDVTPVVASSNGQRVSQQYLQALSVLVPKFNAMMPVAKNAARDFLDAPVDKGTLLDGQQYTGTLQGYYFQLYGQWVALKLKWDQDQQDVKDRLVAADPATAPEQFLEWYERTAEGRLAELDAAMGKVLAVFSPSDMDALLGMLASGPGGQIDEAVNIVKDIRLMSPSGGYIYPVDLTPDDWFLDLASDLDPVDLLKAPEFIGAEIATKRQALAASISQIQALLDTVPSTAAMKAAVDAFGKAQGAYSAAQDKLIDTYTDNTAIAVEIYLAKHPGDAPQPAPDQSRTELNANATAASKAKGEQPPATGAQRKTGPAINNDDVQQIVNGQKALVAAQSGLMTSAQSLADAGLELGADQAQNYTGLSVLLARLRSQLSDLAAKQQDLAAAAASSLGAAPATPAATCTQDTIDGAAKVASGISDEAAKADATAASVLAAVAPLIAAQTPAAVPPTLAPLQAAAAAAAAQLATAAEVAVAVRAASDALSGPDDLLAEARTIASNAETAAGNAGATAQNVVDAVTAAVAAAAAPLRDGLAPLTNAAADAQARGNAQAIDVAKAVKATAAAMTRAPRSEPSGASQRFMTVQMAFSSDEMQTSHSASAQFSSSQWGANLFFGSVGGSSSSMQALSADKAFEANTSIEIGFKVAKVDIGRQWFDPGLFKLTADMSRLSTQCVSTGGLQPGTPDADGNPTTAWPGPDSGQNAALLPCFPVAFLVAKDVTIRFQASTSSMDAIRSVIDSRSAIGGGFLCFSASSTSGSQQESQSIVSKAVGKNFSIFIPGPQVLGWFMETVPEDKSTVLVDAPVPAGTELNIIQYLKAVRSIATSTADKSAAGAAAAAANETAAALAVAARARA